MYSTTPHRTSKSPRSVQRLERGVALLRQKNVTETGAIDTYSNVLMSSCPNVLMSLDPMHILSMLQYLSLHTEPMVTSRIGIMLTILIFPPPRQLLDEINRSLTKNRRYEPVQ